MKDKIRNKDSVIAGLSIASAGGMYLAELFQAFIAWILGADSVQINFSIVYLSSGYSIEGLSSSMAVTVICLSPFIFHILCLEIGTVVLRATSWGFKRFTAIMFQVSTIGFLLLRAFYGSFSVVMSSGSETDFNILVNFLQLEETMKIFFAFFIIIIFFTYVSLVTGRIRLYINA